MCKNIAKELGELLEKSQASPMPIEKAFEDSEIANGIKWILVTGPAQGIYIPGIWNVATQRWHGTNRGPIEVEEGYAKLTYFLPMPYLPSRLIPVSL